MIRQLTRGRHNPICQRQDWLYQLSPLDGKIYAIGGGKAYPADAFATVEEFTLEVSVTAISPQGKLATAWGKIKQNR